MTFNIRREADRLFRAIVAKPGIKLRDLHDASQSLSPYQRQDCLAWLVSLGRIREASYQPKRGKAGKCFWPVEGVAAPAEDPTSSQLTAALFEINEAKTLLATALAKVETAAKRLAELEAALASETVAA